VWYIGMVSTLYMASKSGAGKSVLYTIYIYKRTFCQDRLGTNIGKVEKREAFFAGGAMPVADPHGHGHGGGVHSHGASGFSRAAMMMGGRARAAAGGGGSGNPLQMRGVHGDHSHGNSVRKTHIF